MNITKHAKKRYLERILKAPENEVAVILSTQEERICGEIAGLFKESKKIYSGQIGGDKTSKDFFFHPKHRILFVVKESEQKMVTMFRPSFAFPEKASEMLIDSLVEEIGELSAQLEEQKRDRYLTLDELGLKKETLERKIHVLESEIVGLKVELANIENGKKSLSADLQKTQALIDQYAVQLIGMGEYKADLERCKQEG